MLKMDSIEFWASFGNRDSRVELSIPGGTGSELYHIYVDRFVYGQIIKRKSGWDVCLNHSANEKLTYEDQMVLIEIVEQHQAEINSMNGSSPPESLSFM